jgi:NAD(P)-dependent dehydrogenase (short-subunit alcohol dehydrogenase family)
MLPGSDVGDPLRLFRLDGRVAIVTGAAAGIGARFARVLAAVGASVVLGDRRFDDLEPVAKAIGERAVAVRCDVASDDEVEALVATAVERFGRLDVLVNNAAIVTPGDEDESVESFQQVLEVNLTGAYRCLHAAGRPMLERGSGSVVNVSSISGVVGMFGLDPSSYGVSKAGLLQLTREFATAWASRGVRVNALSPAYFHTPMTDWVFTDPRGIRHMETKTPMGRGGLDHELDGALLFLASDASSYVTGHNLVVDGGWTAY